jgi:lipid-A-disaccharide synthase
VAVRSAGYELDDDSHSLLRRATVAAVCSGTATLEAALLDVPQVVVYKTSGLNYQIARRVVKISEVGLVNVVAGRKIVPELLQDDFTPDDLARELARLLDNPARREEIHCDYDNVRCSLGEPGAAGRVAEIAVGMGD